MLIAGYPLPSLWLKYKVCCAVKQWLQEVAISVGWKLPYKCMCCVQHMVFWAAWSDLPIYLQLWVPWWVKSGAFCCVPAVRCTTMASCNFSPLCKGHDPAQLVWNWHIVCVGNQDVWMRVLCSCTVLFSVMCTLSFHVCTVWCLKEVRPVSLARNAMYEVPYGHQHMVVCKRRSDGPAIRN